MSFDPKNRKDIPMARGLLDFFPDACAAVAALSLVATKQHHPDREMFWDRDRSMDHADALVRHLVDRGAFDTDGQRHSAKVAWRALALLQIELEASAKMDRVLDIAEAEMADLKMAVAAYHDEMRAAEELAPHCPHSYRCLYDGAVCICRLR